MSVLDDNNIASLAQNCEENHLCEDVSGLWHYSCLNSPSVQFQVSTASNTTTTIMLWSQVDIKFTTFTFLGLVTGIIYNIYNTKTIQWQAKGEVVAIATEPGPKCYLFAITFSFLHH